jgi:hypothetical protein
MVSAFERFIGVDWSGAQDCSHGSIRVAELCRADRHPRLLDPRPFGKPYWTRSAVFNYIKSLDDRRTLVGLDFCFSLPGPAREGSLPPWEEEPNDAQSLWQRVENLCVGEEDLFADPVWLSKHSPFRPFIYHYHSKHRGELYCRERLRLTERAACRRPISIFHMAGAQVGQGSFAGMRLLHRLRDNSDLAIWPFRPTENSQAVIVEVYPSLFYSQAASRRPRKTDGDVEFFGSVFRALSHFGISHRPEKLERSVDAADAMIAAAALAHLSQNEMNFSVSSIGSKVAQTEDWIFGVPFEGTQ